VLTKEVCRKCWGKDWSYADDRHWGRTRMYVYCNLLDSKGDYFYLNRGGPPPAKCSHALEHAVSETLNESR
jgi:hypothetical protein